MEGDGPDLALPGQLTVLAQRDLVQVGGEGVGDVDGPVEDREVVDGGVGALGGQLVAGQQLAAVGVDHADAPAVAVGDEQTVVVVQQDADRSDPGGRGEHVPLSGPQVEAVDGAVHEGRDVGRRALDHDAFGAHALRHLQGRGPLRRGRGAHRVGALCHRGRGLGGVGDRGGRQHRRDQAGGQGRGQFHDLGSFEIELRDYFQYSSLYRLECQHE